MTKSPFHQSDKEPDYENLGHVMRLGQIYWLQLNELQQAPGDIDYKMNIQEAIRKHHESVMWATRALMGGFPVDPEIIEAFTKDI